MAETMELVVIDAQNAVEIFTGGGLNALLDGIEAKVKLLKFDPSTVRGREEIRSVAYQVTRTKTALDAEGKRLTEGWREATKKVNEQRKLASDRLESLAEQVRKPLTEFETKERLRVESHEKALAEIISFSSVHSQATQQELIAQLLDFDSLYLDRNWEEFSQRAESKRIEIRSYLAERLDARVKFDAEQAELARLRREAEDQMRREREEKIRAEAAETARLQAERKAKEAADAEAKRIIEAANIERARVEAEARRVEAENQRLRLEAEAKAKAERDRLVAEALAAEKRAADAETARLATEKKAQEDLRNAAREERERIESERKANEMEDAKRAADKAHRENIHREIANDCAEKSANEIATAIMGGKVRHVRVIF